jgi:hypothetical protein
MPRKSFIAAPPDDPSPTCHWEIIHGDTFDRDEPARAEVEGTGVIPGLMELWASFLFETVHFGSRSLGNGQVEPVALKGFSSFHLWFDGGTEGVWLDGCDDWTAAGRLKR